MLYTFSQTGTQTSRLLMQEQKEGRICLYHSENRSEAENETVLRFMFSCSMLRDFSTKAALLTVANFAVTDVNRSLSKPQCALNPLSRVVLITFT